LVQRNEKEGYTLRRLNLWGGMDLCFRPDYKNPPCGDKVMRLAKRKYPYFGDAESLAVGTPTFDFMDRMNIFHYSYVRKPDIALDKAIWMLGWFWGNGETDPRLVEQKERLGVFNAYEFHGREALMPIPLDHPASMKQWADERRPLLEGMTA